MSGSLPPHNRDGKHRYRVRQDSDGRSKVIWADHQRQALWTARTVYKMTDGPYLVEQIGFERKILDFWCYDQIGELRES